MIPVGYLITVTASESDRQGVQTVLKIAGCGQEFFGSTTEAVSIHLFVIRESKKSPQELTTQLQAVPGFLKVAVIALSTPIREAELSEVRELFTGLGWDASGVANDELSLFINDKLLGQYTCYIDLDRKKYGGLITMRIKRLEDHPQFSPDWLKDNGRKKEGIQDEEQSFEDIETHESVIEIIEEEEVEPPPPPPPPPANLEQMTDMQIRYWIRKNDGRILSDENIEIKRSSEEILITITIDGEVGTVIYKLTT